jgi:hypothetical protein
VLEVVDEDDEDDVELDELVDDEVLVDELVVDDEVLVDVLLELLDDVDDDVLEDVELDDVELELLDDVDDDVLEDVELDDVELELVVEELVLLDVLLLLDDVVDVVDVDVVVVGGGGRPTTGIRAARHLAVVPGTVCATEVHRPAVLLSQLKTVPTSTMPSLSVSTQVTVRLSMFRSVLTPCSMSPHVSATVSPW